MNESIIMFFALFIRKHTHTSRWWAYAHLHATIRQRNCPVHYSIEHADANLFLNYDDDIVFSASAHRHTFCF